MFSFLKKDPKQQLQKRYNALLAEATDYQRKGDIRQYSKLITESEVIAKQMDELESKN